MDILDLVGHTPLVELVNCSPKPGIRLFAKLEGQNPTGSIKDRVVAFLLREARESGMLQEGQEIVEATTGNTGIALAMMGRRLGHPVRLLIPDTIAREIVPALEMFGPTIEWVRGDVGIKRAVEVAGQIARDQGAFLLNQFGSAGNVRCHYETTGAEIVADCPEVDVLVCGLGTGGTIMGAGRRVRENNPEVLLVAAEPHPGEHLQGLRDLQDGFVPAILDMDFLDAKILVRNTNALRAVHEVLIREGVFGGPSSGAVTHAALQFAERLDHANMVLMFADAGWKYLSSLSPAAPQSRSAAELDDVLWW